MKFTITLSGVQIFLITVAVMLLFFTVIKPSIARGVCHTEALRRDLHDFFTDPQESKRNRENMLANVDKLYQECKVYNAGKIYEDYILRDMQL